MSTEKLLERIERSIRTIGPFWEEDVAEMKERFGGPPDEWARWRVHTQDEWIMRAVLARGRAVQEACQVLLAPLEEEVRRSDAKDPNALSPNLPILGMINMLQCLGLEPAHDAVDMATGWLIGMDTAGVEPPWWHWERGLAGLAFGQPRVYRPVAGYSHDQSISFVPGADPGFNVQGWIAHFAGAVEAGAGFTDVEPAWRSFLGVYEDLVDSEAITEGELFWFARIVRHTICGAPLGEVADWLHHNVRAFVGLD